MAKIPDKIEVDVTCCKCGHNQHATVKITAVTTYDPDRFLFELKEKVKKP